MVHFPLTLTRLLHEPGTQVLASPSGKSAGEEHFCLFIANNPAGMEYTSIKTSGKEFTTFIIEFWISPILLNTLSISLQMPLSLVQAFRIIGSQQDQTSNIFLPEITPDTLSHVGGREATDQKIERPR